MTHTVFIDLVLEQARKATSGTDLPVVAPKQRSAQTIAFAFMTSGTVAAVSGWVSGKAVIKEKPTTDVLLLDATLSVTGETTATRYNAVWTAATCDSPALQTFLGSVTLPKECWCEVEWTDGNGTHSVAFPIRFAPTFNSTEDTVPSPISADEKTTPVNADRIGLFDSAAAFALKWLTWSNLKATLKTYFDTLYAAITHNHSATELTSGTIPDARFPATLPALDGSNLTNLNASALATGTIDPARIPVLYSGIQVVSSGGIADLTSPQQAAISGGAVVTTTDGRRWVYSGSGSKTSEGSYIELADVTPAWSVIAGKPSVFPPEAHTHAQSEITDLEDDLAAKVPTSRQVTGANSIVGGGDLSGDISFNLDGDNDAPGPNKVYGTDGIGEKGWKNDPAGGGLASWLIKTANHTAVNGDRIQADSSGGAFTITLPATPSDGTEVWIEDARFSWAANNVTLGRNGESINGSAADMVLDVNGDAVKAVFITGYGWSIK